MQQAGQVPDLDQNDAHEQSLGQSDGSLPGPKQTLNDSVNQSIKLTVSPAPVLTSSNAREIA